jgi:large subunit ribosomal protein L28
MSRRCAICDKGPTVDHRVGHAHNLTKRRWLPNLQKIN